jgi:flagellar hook assembly protein FlgD
MGGAIAGRVGLTLGARPLPAAGEVTVDWQGDPSGTVEQWLEVHDLAGRLRRRIVVGREPGGAWQWNGRDEEGVLVPAGLYFVRLVSGSRHATSRVVFVR